MLILKNRKLWFMINQHYLKVYIYQSDQGLKNRYYHCSYYFHHFSFNLFIRLKLESLFHYHLNSYQLESININF